MDHNQVGLLKSTVNKIPNRTNKNQARTHLNNMLSASNNQEREKHFRSLSPLLNKYELLGSNGLNIEGIHKHNGGKRSRRAKRSKHTLRKTRRHSRRA